LDIAAQECFTRQTACYAFFSYDWI